MDNKERKLTPPQDTERIHENKDRERYEETSGEKEQPVDLDGDGFIGNTGGFYGGTSYVGSNYGADWNADDNSQHEGNYGAAGQQDATDLTDDNHPTDRDRT